MTRPLTPAEILTALERFGIPYHEQAGWTTRHNGSGWGDVVGFMWHHTGDDAADDVDLRIVTNGRAGLSGPLCQFGLRDDGSVDLVASGAANHAGGGDPRVLAAVRIQAQALPKPRFVHGEVGSISGNSRFYGVETYYSGGHAPTAAVAAMMPRLAAAILDALDRIDNTATWTSKRAIGHKEWQRGKVDPGSIDCYILRAQTQALLDNPTGDDMSAADVSGLQAGLVAIRSDIAAHDKRELGRYSDVVGREATQTAQVTALTAQVTALTATVQTLAAGKPGVDPVALLATVTAAVKASLANLSITLTNGA